MCIINYFKLVLGGGSIPTTNDTLDQVLDALAPQSKYGIQGQDNETDPFSGGNNNEVRLVDLLLLKTVLQKTRNIICN